MEHTPVHACSFVGAELVMKLHAVALLILVVNAHVADKSDVLVRTSVNRKDHKVTSTTLLRLLGSVVDGIIRFGASFGAGYLGGKYAHKIMEEQKLKEKS
ncbi:hypothetical protein Y032_0021g340 [Ancylostoma ceylanicum]|uniref:Uncharacterized protein n=1 Tax=Ancylostoma ceylanicum TaxID=53326 RepID=A0A016UZ19_9BILA|nr:hypothetical protein Y032_0021g340 [Ancylostoma ceylanicum]